MAAAADDTSPRAGRSLALAVAVWVVCSVPLVVALVALASPHWYPVLDMAQTELRIRDVWSLHPPLIGLPGRIGSMAEQGSHPGPISFWLLAPGYRLFGSTGWAMDVSAVLLNSAVIGGLVATVRRRGGTMLLLGFGAVFAWLLAHYGSDVLALAWNPYLPVLWWLLFVLAVWSVLCDDWAFLPVVVLAGTFCVQTHVSYAALVAALGLLALGWSVTIAVRRWSEPAVRRRAWLWGGVTVGLTVLLWLPPVIQQLTGQPANLSLLFEYFTESHATVGIGEGMRLFLLHLDPASFLTRSDGMTGSVVPGVAVGIVWLASVYVAYRMRVRDVLRLDLVLAVASVAAVVSAARIFGYLWFYLVLWSWGIAALMFLTIGWTIALAVAQRPDVAQASKRWSGALAIGLAVVMLAGCVRFAVQASDASPPDQQPTRMFRHLIGPTLSGLEAGKIPGTGTDGRYMVTFTDSLNIGADAYGLVLELERQGLDAGMPNREVIIPNRKITTADATAVVHLAVGKANIARWRAKRDVHEVAFYDPRSPAQRAEYSTLRERVVRALRAAGQEVRAREVDDNLFVAIYRPGLPADLKPVLERMLHLGQPSAVFVGPPQIDAADN